MYWNQNYAAISATQDADTGITMAYTGSTNHWTWSPNDITYVGTWEFYIKCYFTDYTTLEGTSNSF